MALAAPALAQEKAKPNTLTPKEIADGWILLFDGDTTFGWKIDGEASVVDGVLRLRGKNATLADWDRGKHATVAKFTTAFGSFEMQFESRGMGKHAGFTVWGGGGSRFEHTSDDWSRTSVMVEYDAAKRVWKFSRNRTPPPADGIVLGDDEITPIYANQNSLGFEATKDSTVFIRNCKLKPTNQKPIYNGKGLTGWKEIPGKKSKFTVTDKGELNVKDGPGDLQTTGEWDDFVLQFDVFSNGKHLNSGVFFRCQPGESWSGYEAKIRNQWKGDDRTKPVDYGTGGIYNLQPARKVVSSDKEWFTMTVVAHGNHMATWVNGYQVTDFTDTRKENASARDSSSTRGRSACRDTIQPRT